MAADTTPPVETQTVSETRRTFSETLDRVYRGEARVIVERSGIAVGVVVSPRDLAALERLDQQRREALQALADIQASFADIPEDELERELASALAEAKEIRRQERQHLAKRSA